MEKSIPSWQTHGLSALLERRDLSPDIMRAAVTDLTTGTFDESIAAAFLVALRMKGETAEEIAAAAQVLRQSMIRLRPPEGPVLDTCGTGGDGSGTFNISTAVALVVAGAGVPVVKHGNRSVSSRSGSADVLTALGVNVEGGPEWSQRAINRCGLAFCFAPHFHPALAKVGPLRRKLGVRTVFNLLGPLLSPAGAGHQLLGVGKMELLDPLAGALACLGTGHSFLVCGEDGLDEVTLAGPTQVRRVIGNRVDRFVWTASDFGLPSVDLATLRADGPVASAEMIRGVLEGVGGPARSIVLANASAALLAVGLAQDLRDGTRLASESIDSGSALRTLEALIAIE